MANVTAMCLTTPLYMQSRTGLMTTDGIANIVFILQRLPN
jgi:hypothetical protein